MRIMIVDDEIQVAEMLAESVTRQGHEAIVVSNGLEGLSVINHRSFDAVFLDIVMPKLNGIELLRRIRERHPALPVIVITGNASADEVDEARRLGVTDVIEKPFGLRNFTHALSSLAAGRS